MVEVFKQSNFESIDAGDGVHGYSLPDYQARDIARQANRILEERGVKVTCSQETEYKTWHASSQGYCSSDSHTALLINIQPIRKDTAESLLRELVAAENADAIHMWNIVARARKLLEGK